MNESDYNSLREKSWRGQLTPRQEADLRAWLAAHPEAEADWELEGRLTRVLGRLPDVPVPSNFTARVLQEVARQPAPAAARFESARAFWRAWLPKAAVAALVLLAGVFTFHEQRAAHQKELVSGVKVVAGVSSLPSPEILQDFDTIRQMSTSPGPDQELIALMK